MKLVFGWSVFVGLIWVLVFVGLQAVGALYPAQAGNVEHLLDIVTQIGKALGDFVKPILQLALVLIILIEAAKRLGLISDDASLVGTYRSLAESASIQAVIAIIIVVAVSISALAGIGDTGVLKDLALVVVGFYFGTHRSQVGLQPGTTLTTAPTADPQTPAS
jgi:hypothetical protein